MASRRPGDWDCPSCSELCFASRTSCFKCGTKKPFGLDDGGKGSSYKGYGGGKSSYGKSSFGGKPGDWLCPNCGDTCFGSKNQCWKCGQDRGSTPDMEKGYTGDKGYGGGSPKGGSGFGGKSTQKGKPGDWDCLACSKLNFASRDVCFDCGAERNGAAGRSKGDFDDKGSFGKGKFGGYKGGYKDGGKDFKGKGSFYGKDSYGKSDKGYYGSDKGKGFGKGFGGKKGGKPGDWICPNSSCGDMQFASRDTCRMCGAEKPVGPIMGMGPGDRVESGYRHDSGNNSGDDYNEPKRGRSISRDSRSRSRSRSGGRRSGY